MNKFRDLNNLYESQWRNQCTQSIHTALLNRYTQSIHTGLLNRLLILIAIKLELFIF